jgi:pectinesterase
MGYTQNSFDFESNTVTLMHNASLATGAASDDLTCTRVLFKYVSLYNLDIRNDFGVAFSNGQAIALSNQGNQVGVMCVAFFRTRSAQLFVRTGHM